MPGPRSRLDIYHVKFLFFHPPFSSFGTFFFPLNEMSFKLFIILQSIKNKLVDEDSRSMAGVKLLRYTFNLPRNNFFAAWRTILFCVFFLSATRFSLAALSLRVENGTPYFVHSFLYDACGSVIYSALILSQSCLSASFSFLLGTLCSTSALKPLIWLYHRFAQYPALPHLFFVQYIQIILLSLCILSIVFDRCKQYNIIKKLKILIGRVKNV